MRELLPDLLTSSGVPKLFQPFTHGRAVVFMLHRFENGATGIRGHDPDEVRRGINYLREQEYELLSLPSLFTRLRTGDPPLRKAIAFTMDDGYEDQASVGFPLFEEHDCPLTLFLTTGFLDRELWLWWDQIEYIFLQTERRRLEVEVGGERVDYESPGGVWSERQWSHFVEMCKRVPEEEKVRAIDRLSEAAGVQVPRHPPEQFAPMTWQMVRKAEKRGIVTFGPHTVTHPILARADDSRVRRELEGSWRRLSMEVERPLPIFGYPNGSQRDYGAREISILRELGFTGAMAVQEGYVDAHFFRKTAEEAFRVPRVGYPGRFRNLVQRITGVDRFRELFRSEG